MICATPIMKGPRVGQTATGTTAGYSRHIEAGEAACDDCAAAWKQRMRRIHGDQEPKTRPEPVRLIDEDDWRAEAACWGADSEIFFLEPHQSADPAREICATCTVTDACLNYALRNRITVGVWGGKTLKERQRLARQRKDLL